jgi:hypothetical protein
LSEPQTGEDVIHFTERVALRKRTYLSIVHIQAATLFARLVAKIEKTYTERTKELFEEHRAYVTGSIFSAVSFLEATINELFADAADNVEMAQSLDSHTRQLMAKMWRRGIPRRAGYSVPEKFQIALILGGKEVFDEGMSPYQDIAVLVKLRNALVHYEPEWVTTFSEAEPDAVTIQRLDKMLRGKFMLNPMTVEADTFFPNRCLSHGCASWAVYSSLKFADAFFVKMNLPIPYQHVRSRLSTE